MSAEKHYTITKWSFWMCLAVAIFLMVGGAITPPPFEIDSSIFKAVGWLFGFAALGQLPELVASAKSVKIQRGDTTVHVDVDKIEDEEIKEENTEENGDSL